MPAPDKASQQTGRKLKRFAVIVALILIASFLFVHYQRAREEAVLKDEATAAMSAAPAVDVVTVRDAPPSFSLTLPGETAAWYESVIYARVDGYVAKWNVDIGDHVQKGQVLATLETPDLDAQLAASVAKLQAAKAQVTVKQADADFAKTTYERWKNSPKGVVSEQERDAKKAGYDSAVAQLTEAQAQVGLDQADVDRYTTLAQFKQVTAPYDGVITERHIDIGNLVTAGSTSNTTPLYRMVQDDPIRVFVDVPQSAADDMKTDLPVEVMASNIADRVFEGKVTRTADAIDQQTRTLHVEADIPNTDHALVAGMYVKVRFNVPTGDLVQVPAATLIFRPAGVEVAVVDKDDKVSFHQVKIARDNGNTVELASGVSSGDRIALNISSQIAEGDKVEPHEVKKDVGNAQTLK
ncbi:MAG: efflux RND transporter periplasmic adaptor subunit [Alphaproteobacteria bacterium]|nr:efflux RND transporter periplasmic adaptor subunit [Alphaproteobacteria bacterium]